MTETLPTAEEIIALYREHFEPKGARLTPGTFGRMDPDSGALICLCPVSVLTLAKHGVERYTGNRELVGAQYIWLDGDDIIHQAEEDYPRPFVSGVIRGFDLDLVDINPESERKVYESETVLPESREILEHWDVYLVGLDVGQALRVWATARTED